MKNPKLTRLKKKSSESRGTKSASPEKIRLDVLLHQRGLAPSRERAQAMLLAGQILVNQQPAGNAGMMVPRDVELTLVGRPLPYVSRGGLKLEGALEDFHLSPEGRVCLDVGSSTGGFTDCLLQRGAAHVYALDVNVAQLDWKISQDSRVTVLKCNARYLQASAIPERPQFVTVDVSFISVVKILPAIFGTAAPGADFLILIKPQFELKRHDVGKGGIVREPALHQRSIESVTAAASELGLEPQGVHPSRVPGAEGNLEFFLHARRV